MYPDRYRRYGNRKSRRLKCHNYTHPASYFITTNTKFFRRLFGHSKGGKIILNDYGKIVKKYWCHLSDRFECVSLGEYIIMPDHVHGIIHVRYPPRDPGAQRESLPSLGEIIAAFKSTSTLKCWGLSTKRGERLGTIWQRDYHDDIIRDARHLHNVSEYIRRNPENYKR